MWSQRLCILKKLPRPSGRPAEPAELRGTPAACRREPRVGPPLRQRGQERSCLPAAQQPAAREAGVRSRYSQQIQEHTTAAQVTRKTVSYFVSVTSKSTTFFWKSHRYFTWVSTCITDLTSLLISKRFCNLKWISSKWEHFWIYEIRCYWHQNSQTYRSPDSRKCRQWLFRVPTASYLGLMSFFRVS